jgi:hypothetical protein
VWRIRISSLARSRVTAERRAETNATAGAEAIEAARRQLAKARDS